MSPALRPLRKRESMPDFVREALHARGLWDAYNARPPYQRNDYLLWINKVKRQDTKDKHLAQMLDELEAGGVYMGMAWSGTRSGPDKS
ncbi:YdeI/OmpD-associated family protein [Pelagibacterium luteolum]|uniref:Bacteriocin-protection, YdeI or OmpD-Associated n=1 Tax=Pelagibacterium luteolum TaxID=440168 RepID=A0A1G7TDT4_9HYPH|nr:YdeI/OmpD-associated family protein [Pelagibacterium luteolum]SDG33473.1 Bacteriocin-protection, YdeI or OmpD-Associated [Pelagibacterium luteolum]